MSCHHDNDASIIPQQYSTLRREGKCEVEVRGEVPVLNNAQYAPYSKGGGVRCTRVLPVPGDISEKI